MVRIEIKTAGDAFKGDRKHREVSRILHRVASRVGEGSYTAAVTDIEGNVCGSVSDTDPFGEGLDNQTAGKAAN